VGIGECGFDYFRNGFESKNNQQEIFEKQISIANEVKKPLMLHLRNGMSAGQNAYRDAIEILKNHSKVHGDAHFFVGNWEEGRSFIDLGFRLSFTGVITFVRDYDDVIRNAPMNMILSETDSPYVSPIPYRGQRNEPCHVIEVVNMISKIKAQTLDNTASHLVDNAKNLFSI
jgi:TatD DNase family protein